MYSKYEDGDTPDVSFNIKSEEQTLLFCRNFSDQEIKELLLFSLRVNPIALLNSNSDRADEFNDQSMLLNICIPNDWV